MLDFDLWGTREDTRLQETLSTIERRVSQLEQEIYTTTKILEDKNFIDKYKINTVNHKINLNKLELERKELLKLKRKYEKELATISI